MKAYDSLSLEIIRFEAQDVVTASVADTNCVCSFSDVPTGVPWVHSYNGYNCTADVHKHDGGC